MARAITAKEAPTNTSGPDGGTETVAVPEASSEQDAPLTTKPELTTESTILAMGSELAADREAASGQSYARVMEGAAEDAIREAQMVPALPMGEGTYVPAVPAGLARAGITERWPEVDERIASGKALRQAVPRESHGDWKPESNRRNPVDILQEQDRTRVQALLPLRYGRMLQTPFTFYRGAAAVMAADLAHTPVAGIRVQACGDCHLVNFGGFATPERNIIFDINDFDETLPAPWEWDVKRLAASFVVAGRNNGFSDADSRAAAREMVRTYRTQMGAFAQMPVLEVWYAKLDMDRILAETKDEEWVKKVRTGIEKLKGRTAAEYDFPKMAEQKGAKPVIKDTPPLIFHAPGTSDYQAVVKALEKYRDELLPDRRYLFDRFGFCDVAFKVVGVGSVGTVCAVMLFLASQNDPLFLQAKEAKASVLEPYAGKSKFATHGERIVTGQRLMQSATDIFLGWTVVEGGRHFYIRQLRDMKLKPVVETYNPSRMFRYAQVTGWTLARAHARTGDSALISGYMGRSDVFDLAIERFAVAYADQTERDHAALTNAARSGRIDVLVE